MKNTIQLSILVFKSALAGLCKVVLKKTTLPVLQSIKVSRDEHGVVFLQACDLESHATFRHSTEVKGQPLEFLFPVDALIKATKSLRSTEELALILENSETVLLRYWVSGKAVDQKTSIIPLKEWPQEPKVQGTSMLLNSGFKSNLAQAFECSSTDESRYVLNGVCIDVSKPKAHYLVGTNGRILYCANSFHLNLEKPVIIPNRKFLGWSGFSEDGDWSLRLQPLNEVAYWLRLDSENWSFVTKSIDGQYPHWQAVEPDVSRFKTQINLNEEAIQQLLDLIPKVPGNTEPNYTIGLEVRETELFITGRENETSDLVHIPVIGTTITGPAVEIYLNRQFLAKALRFGLNQIHLTDGLTPLLFQNGGRKLIVMPFRPPQGPAPAPSSAAPEQPVTEPERKTMPETTSTTMSAPPRGNLKTNASSEENSTLKELIEKVEQIKSSLKDVANDLNDTLPLLRQAMKEQKATEKEFESVRSTIRSLQKVEI